MSIHESWKDHKRNRGYPVDKAENTYKFMFWSFAAGIITMIIFLLSSCQKTDTLYRDNAVQQANKAQIDSLQREIAQRDSVISRLQSASKASVVKQKDISKSFKPVYDKIHNADSIELLNQLPVLITEAKRVYSEGR